MAARLTAVVAARKVKRAKVRKGEDFNGGCGV
jgi:hypothetical protein